jgi:CheY-like chemotaxis protein
VSTTEVLIIDDDRTMRDGLTMLLEFEGYAVSSCESGALAFDLVKAKCFDVLLIDYRMPEMTGDEVVRLLRPLCPDALLIGVSIETKERVFLTAGADAFISKNMLVHELVPLIVKHGIGR